MSKRLSIVSYAIVAVLTLAAIVPGLAKAQSADDTSALLAQIQTLTAQLMQLQEQVAAMRGEVKELREELKGNLQVGMRDEDVRKIQALLASDPEIYPEGLTTGYYGPLTTQALKRFQSRFDLAETGQVDEATKDALEALLEERMDGRVPPGLLRAPGIQKKIEDKVLARICTNGNRGVANIVRCANYNQATDDDDDNELEIEVEIENGVAEVDIDFGDDSDKDDIEFEMDFTTEAAVIAEIMSRTELTETGIKAVIEFEYEDESEDKLEIEVEIENGVAEVDIDFGDDSDKDDIEFEMDFTTEAAVIAEIMSRTDLTESEIEEVIEFEYEDDDEDENEDDDDDDDDEEDDDNSTT